MKYRDFIEVNSGFQSSINLEYDLNKIEKIRSYIPTEQSIKMLGVFLRSFYYDKDPGARASVLLGPYGRGKSHLMLVLTALTSLDVFKSSNYSTDIARDVQLELCNKISAVDPEIGALAKAVVEEKIRTLPIIINSNSTDISQAFLIALKNALEIAGLNELLPTTHFDAAIEMIDKWGSEYPSAIKVFKEELSKRKISYDDLYYGLKK